MFSKSCEYGIRAAIYVAKHSLLDEKVSVNEIAEHTESPPAFMAKILQKLIKNKILFSTKGPKGGFFINDNLLNQISLLNIVLAMDGDGILENCTLGLRRCDGQKPCPLHYKFKITRDQLKKDLATTSLQSLAEQVSDGIAFLKR